MDSWFSGSINNVIALQQERTEWVRNNNFWNDLSIVVLRDAPAAAAAAADGDRVYVT